MSVSAGKRCSPRTSGWRVSLPTSTIGGRTRRISCTTASRKGICSPLPRAFAVAAASALGVWTSRSIAQFANVAEVPRL